LLTPFSEKVKVLADSLGAQFQPVTDFWCPQLLRSLTRLTALSLIANT